MKLGPVKDVYQPIPPHKLRGEALSEQQQAHYEAWGYSIDYEVDATGEPVPQGGNTAIFRIHPGGLTEPVFVTKPESGANFTVRVLSGEGRLIRARSTGVVEVITMLPGVQVIIQKGEAYSYHNNSYKDLILHDVARPAFRAGDDVELATSYIPKVRPSPAKGYSAVMAESSESGRKIPVALPSHFFDVIGQAMISPTEKPPEEITDPPVA